MEKKLKYGLYILKRDNDHIIVDENEKYEEVFGLWKEIKSQWASSIKEQKPFELVKPIVTAFDPGLIYEVTIRPVAEPVTNTNNPYAQKMQQNGFTNTFGSRGDMLDSGFKF